MELTFIYIFGLCSIMTEFASCFLLQSGSASVAEGFEEWGPWTVVQTQPCLRLRTRNCKEVGCKKQDFSYCPDTPAPQWEPWSQLQCTVVTGACIIARTRNCSTPSVKDCQSTESNQDIHVWGDMKTCPCKEGACIIARTRNCSTPSVKDCQSTESNQDIHVWGDMKTCPCKEGTTALSNQDNGQWGDWSGWKCAKSVDNCYLYRTRECSVADTKNCSPSESSQLTITDGKKCPCGTDAITTASMSPLTTPNGGIDSSTSSNLPTWSDWGQWICHNVDFGCMQHRLRKCSAAGNECQGEHYQMSICDEKNCLDLSRGTTVNTMTLPPTSATPSIQESTTSASIAISTTKIPLTTKASTKLHNLVTDTTSSNLQTSDKTTSVTGIDTGHTSASSKAVTWTEWGQWECHSEQIVPCVLYRRRECNNGNDLDCEKKGGSKYDMSLCSSCSDFSGVTTVKTTTLPLSSATPGV